MEKPVPGARTCHNNNKTEGKKHDKTEWIHAENKGAACSSDVRAMHNNAP